MDEKDFENSMAGHLVKTLSGHVAFKPAPLPGKFEWNNQIVAALQRDPWRWENSSVWETSFQILASSSGCSCVARPRLPVVSNRRTRGFERCFFSSIYLLVDHLIGNPAMTAKAAAQLFQVTAPAGQRMLEKLEREKIVHEVTGRRRNRVWLAQDFVEVFSPDESG